MAMMAKLILILVSSLLAISCGGHRYACDDRPGGYEDVHFIGDTSVNYFILRDTSCFVHLEKIPDIIDGPNIGEFVCFSNALSSEFLLLARENGGMHNQFNYFYLTDSIPSEYRSKIAILGDSVFYTTSGMHIGSSETEFCEKHKGINFSISQSANEKTYEFQDTTNLYQCTYRFNDGKLKYVEFGYVW